MLPTRSTQGVGGTSCARHAPTFRIAALFLALAFVLVSPREAQADVTVTQATGGTNLTVGTFASLTGPVITEGATGDIGLGNIVLQAPAGFEFDPAQNVTATVTNVAGSCGGTRSLRLLGGNTTQTVTPTAGQITINVSRATTGDCRGKITYTNVRVRATASGSGNITKAAGGSVVKGVTNGTTSFGALSTSSLTLTLSTNTADFGTGLGPDGSASNLPAVSAYPDGNTGAYYVRNGAAGSQAVSVTVNSTGPYTASVSATENTGTAGMKISGGSLRWALGDMQNLAAAKAGKTFTTTPDATVFDAASGCESGQPKQQGQCTFRFDYSLRVLWNDSPGTFSSVVTYTARQ